MPCWSSTYSFKVPFHSLHEKEVLLQPRDTYLKTYVASFQDWSSRIFLPCPRETILLTAAAPQQYSVKPSREAVWLNEVFRVLETSLSKEHQLLSVTVLLFITWKSLSIPESHIISFQQMDCSQTTAETFQENRSSLAFLSSDTQ